MKRSYVLRSLWQLLWGPPRAPNPRLKDLLERQHGLEGDVAGLTKRVKALEGAMTGGLRANPRKKSLEDDPGDVNEEGPGIDAPPRYGGRVVAPTSHLASRFRTGG